MQSIAIDAMPTKEALVLLSYECDQRKSKYTVGDLYVMHKYLQSASRLSQIVIPSAPEWFTPLYDIELDLGAWSDKTKIQRGFLAGSPVVMESSWEVDRFVRNVDAQFSLKHQHILDPLGAFHLGDEPFILYPSHSSLAEYLSSQITTTGSINDPVFRRIFW